MLSITEQEFNLLFPNKQHIYELLTTKPKSEGDFIKRYLPSKLWRLNNLYHIVDKVGEDRVFKMNRAQFIVYSKLFQHPRLIVLKSRQQGISTLFLVSFSDDGIFISNLNCGLMAQDREAAETLLTRTKYLWNNFDPHISSLLSIGLPTDNKTELGFSNNSSLYIRTSFRSGTLQRIHISEYGKIANTNPERAKEVKRGSLQAVAPGNVAIVESTAEGVNDFKSMWDLAESLNQNNLAAKDFLAVFLSWLDDPDCNESVDQEITPEALEYFSQLEKAGKQITKTQKNFWVVQHRELGGAIEQEYPATPLEAFSASKDGTYYSRKYIDFVINKGRLKENLCDPNLPVYCVLDFGRNDLMVLLFFQLHGNTIRLIHNYYNSGEGLEHYCNYTIELVKENNWELEEIALPHDASVVDLSENNYRDRQQIMYDNGLTNTVVLEKQGVQAGIELVREAIPYMWIDVSCLYIDSCMRKYTKDWNNVLENWRDTPKRNEYAHGADCVRYMVQYIHNSLGFYFNAKQLSQHKDKTNVLGSQADGLSI